MKARLVRIRGRVQGIGYRDWLLREAQRCGVAGWVRNRRDGSVEALLSGPPDVLGALLLACRAGPPLARVSEIEERFAEAPAEPGFHRRATE